MSNSTLVDVICISPNSSPRTAKIDTITIHHMAVVASADACGAGFASKARKASSNYGIGTASLSVWSDRGSTLDANRVANEALQNGSNPVSVDVSGLNGSYYVGFGFDASSVQITVTVDELRME